MKATLGKCWQTSHGALVFQCSTHDGTQRRKGFLQIDASNQRDPVSFAEEKPIDILPVGGIAMLVRKFLSTSSLSGLAVHSEMDPKGFSVKEYLRLWLQGKTSSGEPCELWMIVSQKPTKEINIIRANQSIGRLHHNAQYTVAKPIPEGLLSEEENVPEDGFQSWLAQVFDSQKIIQKHDVETLDHERSDSSNHQKQNSQQNISELHRSARDRIARRLKTLKKTFLQDQSKIPSPVQLTEAKENAELLRSYLWLVKPESFELKLDAAQTGNIDKTIELDPNLSSGANLERLFNRIKKLEKALELGSPRVQKLAQQISIFESALEQLRMPLYIPTDREVIGILQKLGLERDLHQSSTKSSAYSGAQSQHANVKKALVGRTFRSSSGSMIVLGRTAQESDQVVKSAKSQDWWIHIAGGGHGSHVIVTGSTVRTELPTQDMRDAAILALHFSDRSQSLEGEVYVGRRHQIKKRKGMAPGLWQIDRAETTMIRYTSEELSLIFAREIRDGQQRHQA